MFLTNWWAASACGLVLSGTMACGQDLLSDTGLEVTLHRDRGTVMCSVPYPGPVLEIDRRNIDSISEDRTSNAGRYQLRFGPGYRSESETSHYHVKALVAESQHPSTYIKEYTLDCHTEADLNDEYVHGTFTGIITKTKASLFSGEVNTFPVHSAVRSSPHLTIMGDADANLSEIDPLTKQKQFRFVAQDLRLNDANPKLELVIVGQSTEFPMNVEFDEVDPANSGCWEPISNTDKKYQSAFAGSPILLPEPFSITTEKDLSLPIHFRTWCALAESLSRFDSQGFDDEIMAKLRYTPLEGGFSRPYTVVWRVRFLPTDTQLFFAALLGLVIGFTFKFFAESLLSHIPDNFKQRRWTWIAMQFGLTAASVLVVEVVLGATNHFGKPIVLFGLNLNPALLTPCFAIALLVSGGPQLLSWLHSVWDRFLALIRLSKDSSTTANIAEGK